jgi:hypothetical protein
MNAMFSPLAGFQTARVKATIGFVEFSDHSLCARALEAMQGRDGINIDFAKPSKRQRAEPNGDSDTFQRALVSMPSTRSRLEEQSRDGHPLVSS